MCQNTTYLQSLRPHQLQGVNTHPENSARHSEQTSKLSQAFSMLTDMKALLHIANLAFVRVLKTIKNNQNTKGFNPWKALWSHSLTCLINVEIVKMSWLVKLAVSLMHFLAPTCTDCWLGTPEDLCSPSSTDPHW